MEKCIHHIHAHSRWITMLKTAGRMANDRPSPYILSTGALEEENCTLCCLIFRYCIFSISPSHMHPPVLLHSRKSA